jgi:excisionase family DNA binding protein
MPSVSSAISVNPNSQLTSAKPAKRLLRVKEAAEFLSLSPWKVRQLAQDGKLPVVRSCDGGAWRIDVLDLNAFIERNKTTEP